MGPQQFRIFQDGLVGDDDPVGPLEGSANEGLQTARQQAAAVDFAVPVHHQPDSVRNGEDADIVERKGMMQRDHVRLAHAGRQRQRESGSDGHAEQGAQ